DHRLGLSDTFRDIGQLGLMLRRRGWRERYNPREPGALRAVDQRSVTALAHAGDDDAPGSTALQPAGRGIDFSQAIGKRPVVNARLRPAHLWSVDEVSGRL